MILQLLIFQMPTSLGEMEPGAKVVGADFEWPIFEGGLRKGRITTT